MKSQDVKREIERMTENLKAGSDIHAGNGGYSLGTQEKYDEFVKQRNYHFTNTNNPVDFPKKKEIPMLERFAAQSLVEHEGELIFSKEKFAELIVRECAEISEQSQWSEAKGEYYEGFNEAMIYVSNKIKEHFGVKS
jgi:CTP-dependent riboflavin kinase